MRFGRFAAVVAALVVIAAACGDDDAAGGITIEEPWARASATMQNAGAAYMKITSTDGDTLLSASVDSSIAGMTEVHEVVAVDAESEMGVMSSSTMGDSMDSMGDMSSSSMGDMGGMMRMQPIESLAIPAGETVALAPGGYHIMMMNLAGPLEAGRKFTVTLQFEKAGTVEVEVEVREEAP